jgi:hypothetical protein
VPRVPLRFVPAADLVDLSDRDSDGEVIGESVLIDRLPHSTECDWLRVETWIDHGRRFEDLRRVGVDLDRASPVAMFLFTMNYGTYGRGVAATAALRTSPGRPEG